MRHHRLTRTAALGLAIAALGAPTAAAQPDLRSPDARDAARLSIVGGMTATRSQDLRSPDARDAAVRPSQRAPVVEPASGGVDWLGIGLGVLIVTGLGGAFAVVRHRNGARRHVAATG